MISLIIAVDFDGTICENEYPSCGSPHEGIIKRLLKCKKAGHELILWTCRSGQQLEEAIEYCAVYGLEFDAVNKNLDRLIEMFDGSDSRKVVADIYLDDRAMSLKMFEELV